MGQFQPMASAYMPVQQPYQPYRQPYPQMPTRMVPQIPGRVVNSPDDITVQEVPTDGTVALFPSADGKCIYSKRWTPDGNISTMRFVPEAQPAQPSRLDIIDDRISELFDVVERIEDRLPYDVETKRIATTRREAVEADAAE